MATALKLKNDIKKLKSAINSKATPKSFLPKLKAQLEKAENELASLKGGAKPRKTSTTKGTEKTLSALEKLIQKKKYSVYKGAGVDLKKDAGEGALATGRRVSKGLKANQYGSKGDNKGNVYYEYRPNRLDVKQPKKAQKYPKLEKGGMMDMLKEDDYVWNAAGKKLVVEKVTDAEYYLSGFMQPFGMPFSKDKVHEYIKSGFWSLKPKYADGGMMAKGGYVAVGEKDGYWTIISKPTTKEKAQQVIDMGVPRGEVGKVVTVEEAKAHKKIIGKEYLEDGGMMAKGGIVQFVSSDDVYDNKYFRRFNGAVGSFEWKSDKKHSGYSEGILYPLSDYDKEFYSHLKLKDEEVLLRYKTDMMRSVKAEGGHLIKINLEKGLIYFMSDSEDEKNPKFETQGIKAKYIIITNDYYNSNSMQDGGMTGKGDENKMSFEEFVETLQEYEVEGGLGKTKEKGYVMYYVPKGSPYLNTKFKTRDKKKAYQQYLHMSKMSKGGVTDPMATANEISKMSGVRAVAITEWADKNNINLYEILEDLKSKKIKGMDIMTAISGNPNNKYQKELVAKYSRTKMAKGGKLKNVSSDDGFELNDINGHKIEEGDIVKSTQPSGGILSAGEGQVGVVEKTKDAFGQNALQIRYRKAGKNYDQLILLNGKINEILSKKVQSGKMAYGGELHKTEA